LKENRMRYEKLKSKKVFASNSEIKLPVNLQTIEKDTKLNV